MCCNESYQYQSQRTEKVNCASCYWCPDTNVNVSRWHCAATAGRLQVSGQQRCAFLLHPPLTSSMAETVFRQSLILAWKLDVPGEDRSSFVRPTKSATLSRSGMFPSESGSEDHRGSPRREVEVRKFQARVRFPIWKKTVGESGWSVVRVFPRRAACPNRTCDFPRVDSAPPLSVCVCVCGGALLSAQRGREKHSAVTWECLRSLAHRFGREGVCVRFPSFVPFGSRFSFRCKPAESAHRGRHGYAEKPHSRRLGMKGAFNG